MSTEPVGDHLVDDGGDLGPAAAVVTDAGVVEPDPDADPDAAEQEV